MSLALLCFAISLPLLIIFQVPIALAMVTSTIAYLAVAGQDIGLVVDQIMNSLFNSQPLLAIPMFILAANLMMAGSLTDRLFAAARLAVGRRPGGLAQGVLVMGAVFASMSGTAIGDAASIGRMSVRALVEEGYPRGFAAAMTASASILGPLIPPSIPLLLYGLLANASIGALFLGAIMPGLLILAALMGLVAITAHLRRFPSGGTAATGCSRILWRGAPPLGMPVVLLAGIYGGAFTVTEAAAVAVAYTLLLTMAIYREMSGARIYRVLVETARQTAAVMLIVCGAFAVNYVVTAEQLDKLLAALVAGLGLSSLEFILAVVALFFVLGCFIDASTMLVVLVPVLVPSAIALGVDLVHFGVVVVAAITLGVLTPPFGLVLFVISSMTSVPLAEIIREVAAPVATVLAAIVIVGCIPATVLWLPRAFGMAN